MNHPLIVGWLLGAAVALAIACSIGLLVMRDAYQRLHFSAPVVTLSMLLVTVAVFVDEADSQARWKASLIFILMLVMNSILTHATGRAIRIRETGQLAPRPQERIPIVHDQGVAGEKP